MPKQLFALNFKWRELIKVDVILVVRRYPFLRTVLYPPSELHSGPSQTSKVDFLQD